MINPCRFAVCWSRNRVSDIATLPAGNSQTRQSISEIDVLWITAGLGCDGDTIAMTAATQPSIEDIVPGAMPWIPKAHFHNPFLALENGDDFLRDFHLPPDTKVHKGSS